MPQSIRLKKFLAQVHVESFQDVVPLSGLVDSAETMARAGRLVDRP